MDYAKLQFSLDNAHGDFTLSANTSGYGFVNKGYDSESPNNGTFNSTKADVQNKSLVGRLENQLNQMSTKLNKIQMASEGVNQI